MLFITSILNRLFGRHQSNGPNSELIDHLQTFISVDTWRESKAYLEQHPELLTNEAIQALNLLIQLAQADEKYDVARTYIEHRNLLTRCQNEGIEAAFANDLSLGMPATLIPADQIPSLEVFGKRSDQLFAKWPSSGSIPIGDFSALLAELASLEQPQDMPRRIEVCRAALKLVNRDDLPQLWAALQSDLGYSLCQNPLGNRANNLEQAISHDLTTTYKEHIRAPRANNIEQAIHHFELALSVHTRQEFPVEWAMNQNELGNAYYHRIRESRADNLEQAIFHYREALLVYTLAGFPLEWATCQHNLGSALSNRIRGERDNNLEQAIEHFQQALQVRTSQALSFDWAQTMNRLGHAYSERIRGERALNLEQAIDHYQQALEVITRQAFPEQWARIQSNLANIYTQLGKLGVAISYYQEALEIISKADFPLAWAQLQNNLGRAYYDSYHHGLHRLRALELAIDYYEQALDIYTETNSPLEWAISQHNLALAYAGHISYVTRPSNEQVDNHDKLADNITQAIHAFRHALKIRQPTTLPHECRSTAYLLGRLLYDKKRFAEARDAFVMAHQAIENLRGETSKKEASQRLSSENADLYVHLVHCCLQLKDESAAFEYAVAGKGRAFVDLLATARFDLSTAATNNPALAADWQKTRQLRQQIDDLLSRQMRSSDGQRNNEEREREEKRLRELQQEQQELWEELTYKYPALTATQSVPSLSVAEATALAAEIDATLVEFVRHLGGWSAFVITPQAVHHVPLSKVNNNFLLENVIDWLDQVENPKFHNQESYWSLDEWYEAFIAPFKPYLPPEGKLVLAPAGVLHLIPLSIARNPATERYLCDEYIVSFVPSLAVLRITLEEAKKVRDSSKGSTLRTLLAVAHPGSPSSPDYLPHVMAEVEAIAVHFSHMTPLYAKAATPQAVVTNAPRHDVIHFACHGKFDSDLPELSALVLSGGDLTVQRIITELQMNHSRLVTLSASLTNRAALDNGEEQIGLVQAMMIAGAQAVVASLWKVADEPTRVLFEQFYKAVAHEEPPARALQQAMQFVRQQPSWEHPFYWAAFQVNGLAYDIEV